MILANSIAARYCAENEVPLLYRVQDRPDADLPEMPRDQYDPIKFEQLVKCLKRSRISTAPGEHAGLGVECYAQFTSPIRRYSDLVMQRQLAAALSGEALPYSHDDMLMINTEGESMNGRIRDVQRQSEYYWLLVYVERNLLEKPLEATVVSRDGNKYAIEILSLNFKANLGLAGSFRPGDKVELRFTSVNPKAGQYSLEQVSQ